jgi:hypothetical protein
MNLSRTLIVFPGGGDPESPLYHDVYELIEELALAAGYSSVDRTVRWLGHSSSGIESSLTFDSAVETARNVIQGHEDNGAGYDILARSFGCAVALVAATSHSLGLGKITLWGPSPFWKMWELLVRDLAITARDSAERGLRMDKSLFPSLVPIEVALPKAPVQTFVAYGTKDRLVAESFVDHLLDLSRANPLVKGARSAEGASHEVTKAAEPSVIANYRSALFSNEPQ